MTDASSVEIDWFVLFDKALPTLTFAVGLVGGWVADSLRDNRAYKISRKRDHAEFQRNNFLELQEVLQDMGRSAGRVLMHEKNRQHEASLDGSQRTIHLDAGRDLRSFVSRVRILEERIDSCDIRAAVRGARAGCASFGLPDGYSEQTESEFRRAMDKLSEAQGKIGVGLRRLSQP